VTPLLATVAPVSPVGPARGRRRRFARSSKSLGWWRRGRGARCGSWTYAQARPGPTLWG